VVSSFGPTSSTGEMSLLTVSPPFFPQRACSLVVIFSPLFADSPGTGISHGAHLTIALSRLYVSPRTLNTSRPRHSVLVPRAISSTPFPPHSSLPVSVRITISLSPTATRAPKREGHPCVSCRALLLTRGSGGLNSEHAPSVAPDPL